MFIKITCNPQISHSKSTNPLEDKEKIILGIDPGTTVMGYGIVRIRGQKANLIVHGVIHLDKLSDHALKLKHIFEKTLMLIDEYHPDELAIEAPFYGKNIQSMLKLGRAQGVAIAAALFRTIPIFEYSPKKIKQSITGNGNASKEQVAAMLNHLLNIKNKHDYLDATDALGAAMCHYFQRTGKQSPEKNFSGWKAFLQVNPERASSPSYAQKTIGTPAVKPSPLKKRGRTK